MTDNFVYRPLSELPHDADPTADPPSRYSFGTDVFGGSNDWVIVENNTSPTKVYKLPVPVSRILHHISMVRYDMGHKYAQEKMRRALGLE